MLFKEADYQIINQSKTPIKDWFQKAIDHYMLKIPQPSRLEGTSKPLLLLLLETQPENHDDFSTIFTGQSFDIEVFIEIYNQIYPFLISKYYTPKMIVFTFVQLLKDFQPEMVIHQLKWETLMYHLKVILKIEYFYSENFHELNKYYQIFGPFYTGHRDYRYGLFLQDIYPDIKNKIQMTPNFRYVFEFEEYADNLAFLSTIFETIELGHYHQEIKLANGNLIKPSEYMLSKVRKIQDRSFFQHEILERFEFINKPFYDKETHYLVAPPLVLFMKFERNKKNWIGSHYHLFEDDNDPHYKYMIAQIGNQYYAQRGAGTSQCDHCNRVDLLTPKHTTHIKDLDRPTVSELEVIHQYNLKHQVYMGL